MIFKEQHTSVLIDMKVEYNLLKQIFELLKSILHCASLTQDYFPMSYNIFVGNRSINFTGKFKIKERISLLDWKSLNYRFISDL